ncbi:MAG: gliding motility protein GldM [Flavobacteriaceae bacterium]|jgi:gliding motility-associated protein GldM|nr:gliding motility protein GldM [Flavobacteriaceae bacterium]
MAQGKQTPRQKMINLMYLVFIAMMAMQVDRQVLRSFEGITVTLDESSKLTAENNNTFYEQINLKAGDDVDYLAIQERANQVKAESDKAYNFIESLKINLMQELEYALPDVNAEDEEETNYASLSNTDAVTKRMFDKGGLTEVATELKSTIDGYREFMAKSYESSPRDVNRINQLFSTEDRQRRSWIHRLFYDQPMVAGLANLTKIQSDIRTEEGNLVRALLSNKLEEEIELKAFEPIVMASPIVLSGKPAEANIAFGAFDNTLQGKITIGGEEVPLVNGKATIALNTSGSGQRSISGTMTYRDHTGEFIEPIPFTHEYEVISETLAEMPSGAVISADAMNVVYRGLDNPISATVNGADGPVNLSASAAGLRSAGAGKWMFKPSAGSGSVTFTASARTSTGKTVSGTREFRIKPVPPARAHIANKTSLQIPANGLAAQTVRVDWPDFLFDVKGQVTSFKVKVPGQPTVSVTGDKMSAAAGALSRAKSGDVVGVFDINYSSSAGNGQASSVTIEVR